MSTIRPPCPKRGGRCPATTLAQKARRVADFLAGMTDRYALGEYKRLFGEDLSTP